MSMSILGILKTPANVLLSHGEPEVVSDVNHASDLIKKKRTLSAPIRPAQADDSKCSAIMALRTKPSNSPISTHGYSFNLW